MKYLLINGNPYRDRKEMDQYVDRLLAGIKSAGHEAQALVLRDMKIKPCNGCFSCWVRNPGNCILQDDGNKVTRQSIASDHVILASPLIMDFPLYVDAMPGRVKEFFETLEHYMRKANNPAIGFIIQCGFPETSHNRYVERYCEKFSRRMSCRHLGAILKGGCEGLAIQPSFLTDKYYQYFYMLGVEFGKTGKFDGVLLEKLARPEHLKAENMAQVIPFINQALWDAQMEKNGVSDRSFDKPLMP
jgi:hypothetical protein